MSTATEVLPIWPDATPNAESQTRTEVSFSFIEPESSGQQGEYFDVGPDSIARMDPNGDTTIRNVVTPNLTVFRPELQVANGTGVLILPCGGWRILSMASEGTQLAQQLVTRGFTCFVLKYRLKPTPADHDEFEEQFFRWLDGLQQPLTQATSSAERVRIARALRRDNPGMAAARAAAFEDVQQALRVIRAHAGPYGLAEDQIGVVGFSAGAYLTMDVVMDAPEAHVSFAAPIYGGDIGTRPVPTDPPPLFLMAAQDDPAQPVELTENIAHCWHNAGAWAELHVYLRGGHGFGVTQRGLPIDSWVNLFTLWLEALLPTPVNSQ